MKYSDLKLKTKNEKTILKLNNGQYEIEVLQYLPILDKIDLIDVALQKAEEGLGYNELKLEMYFNLNIVYLYSNLDFTAEEVENEEQLYDELESNGIILDIIGAMNDDEYNFLVDHLEIIKENKMKFKNSVAGVAQSFIQDLPKNAEAAADIVNNFDPEKYQAVLDFAKAANGGRSLN